MNRIFRFLILTPLLLLALACTKETDNSGNENDGGNNGGGDGSPKLELINPDDVNSSPAVSFLGGTFDLQFIAGEDWTATVSYIDGEEWLSVSPEKGSAGENTLTITTLQNNTPESRIARVTLKSGKLMRAIQIEQEAYNMRLVYPQNFISPLGRDIYISISSGYDYEVSEPESDWITFKEEIKDETSTILRYTVAPNTGDNRETKFVLSLKGVEKKEDIIIKQEGINSGNESWINKDFYKHGLLVKFTLSTCKFCPSYSTYIEQARSIMPDRIHTYSVCTNDRIDAIAYKDFDLSTYYNITGTPVGIFDGRVCIENKPDYVVDMITGMAEESLNYNEHVYYNAEVTATSEGSQINVDLKVYSKESGDVRMVVALIEDNIIAAQQDVNYPNMLNPEYKHNHILRKFFTKSQGDIFTFETSGSQNLSFQMDTEGLVTNIDNCKVIVYFFRDILANSSTVPHVSVLRYQEYIDNAIEVKVGEKCELRFE